MTLIEENAVDNSLHGLVDGGVGEDNVGGLATKLQGVSLVGACQALLNEPADFGGASKGNFRDARVRHQRSARGAGAGEDVHNSRGQADVLHELGKLQGGQRRGLGRFQDHRVATGQGRRDLPGRHQQREIPGYDLRRDAQGLGAPTRESVFQLIRPTGVIEKMGGGQWNVNVSGLTNGFAAIQGLDHSEFARPLLQRPGDPIDVLAPLCRFHCRPDILVGTAGSLHGTFHIRGIRLRHSGQHFLAGRVDRVKVTAGGRRYEFPVDEEVIAFIHPHVIDALRGRRVLPIGLKAELAGRAVHH